jgi:hypothetical protein
MSLEQKFKLLTESAKPEPTYKYPETCIRGKMRKFTNSWLQKYPGWLAYSMALDSVFCVPCAIFAENRAGKGKLVNYPFNDWSKLTEKLDNHCKANSDHQNSMIRAEGFIQQMKNPDQSLPVQLDENRLLLLQKNQSFLRSIFRAVAFLGKQGLPFRGHGDTNKTAADDKNVTREISELSLLYLVTMILN